MPEKKIEDLTKSKREGEKVEPPSDLPDMKYVTDIPDIKYVSDRPDLLHVTDRPDIMHISDRPDVLESERRANQKKRTKPSRDEQNDSQAGRGD
jgi:hypothetical protein